jgi:uncharacterized membrane protein YphA (DoxX/SURF4 family)
VKLPSSRTYAFWLAFFRIYAGVFWLLHGIPKFTQSETFMPPNGMIVNFVNTAILNTHGPYQAFLQYTVLPNINVFAELVRLGEVLAGTLLLLGLYSRVGGLIGVVLALNYITAKGGLTHTSTWSSLDSTAFVLSLLSVVLPTGRVFGIDQFLGRKKAEPVAPASAPPAAQQPTVTGVRAEFVDEPPMSGPKAPTR